METLRLNPGLLQARLILATSFLAARQAQSALEIIDQAPEPQKKQVPWKLAHNWALLSMGNIQEARAGIDQLLQEGRTPETVFQNAALRFVERDYAGARASLEELLKRDVMNANVIQLLMQTYSARQELAKGLDRLREIAAAKPQSALLQNLLGEWYKNAGNSAGARKAFESAKAADPKFAPADLALAEMDIQEGRNAAARERLGTVIAGDPKNVLALLLAARADDAAGDRASEIAKYRAVLDVDRSNLVALNNLAYSLAADDPDEALKFAQQAAEKAPDSPNVQDTLGWIYYRKGLYSMAVRYLKTAVDKESNPRRQFHLGMSYLKVGDQSTGQRIVREALQKDPNLAKTEQGW
jgi:tetratricopeptide (TPR) repeat protein